MLWLFLRPLWCFGVVVSTASVVLWCGCFYGLCGALVVSTVSVVLWCGCFYGLCGALVVSTASVVLWCGCFYGLCGALVWLFLRPLWCFGVVVSTASVVLWLFLRPLWCFGVVVSTASVVLWCGCFYGLFVNPKVCLLSVLVPIYVQCMALFFPSLWPTHLHGTPVTFLFSIFHDVVDACSSASFFVGNTLFTNPQRRRLSQRPFFLTQ